MQICLLWTSYSGHLFCKLECIFQLVGLEGAPGHGGHIFLDSLSHLIILENNIILIPKQAWIHQGIAYRFF